mmetsp:Transcript_36369/g.116691  ORF Transcript_36369/g.116691 Transcript_36369/m.116691 type:complete len:120 (-) Transcript_36369:525-884(-)
MPSGHPPCCRANPAYSSHPIAGRGLAQPRLPPRQQRARPLQQQQLRPVVRQPGESQDLKNASALGNGEFLACTECVLRQTGAFETWPCDGVRSSKSSAAAHPLTKALSRSLPPLPVQVS